MFTLAGQISSGLLQEILLSQVGTVPLSIGPDFLPVLKTLDRAQNW